MDNNGNAAVLAGYRDENGQYVADDEAARTIQYIIRVAPQTGATLTATDANGAALNTTKGAGGKDLQWALEGDKVIFKIDLKEGYTLDGAYGDAGQTLPLSIDNNGNYYIVVPKGGGVVLSVKLRELFSKSSRNSGSGSNSSSEAQQFQPAGNTGVIHLDFKDNQPLTLPVLDFAKMLQNGTSSLVLHIKGKTYTIPVSALADFFSKNSSLLSGYITISANGDKLELKYGNDVILALDLDADTTQQTPAAPGGAATMATVAPVAAPGGAATGTTRVTGDGSH